MKAIVIGGDSFIGRTLAEALTARGFECISTTRRKGDESQLYFDLLDPGYLPSADVVYLCAAKTRFIDCESDPEAYRVNVDAPRAIAWQLRALGSKLVYLSSEAVERALHTNYGLHKALAENAVLASGIAIVARLGKTDQSNINGVCDRLSALASASPGVYRLCQ